MQLAAGRRRAADDGCHLTDGRPYQPAWARGRAPPLGGGRDGRLDLRGPSRREKHAERCL